jgi:hypothetical protein
MPIVIPHWTGPQHWFAHHESTRPETQRSHVGQWTIAVTKDPFTGATTCRLRARGMTYADGVMTFDLGRRTRTFRALYKIDQGPATSWRTNAMALARSSSLQTDDLLNPSGGRVLTPLGPLLGAHQIVIRPSPDIRAVTFSLADLSPALDRASASGCGADFPPDPAK